MVEMTAIFCISAAAQKEPYLNGVTSAADGATGPGW